MYRYIRINEAGINKRMRNNLKKKKKKKKNSFAGMESCFYLTILTILKCFSKSFFSLKVVNRCKFSIGLILRI